LNYAQRGGVYVYSDCNIVNGDGWDASRLLSTVSQAMNSDMIYAGRHGTCKHCRPEAIILTLQVTQSGNTCMERRTYNYPLSFI